MHTLQASVALQISSQMSMQSWSPAHAELQLLLPPPPENPEVFFAPYFYLFYKFRIIIGICKQKKFRPKPEIFLF